MSGESSPAAAVPAAIWNVPYPRNPNFTGRGKAMAELRQALTGKAAADRIQVVFGPSGIGKSQLAAEFAYKHKFDYEIVWWLRADEPASLALGARQLAERLGFHFRDATSAQDIQHLLRRVLAQRQNWLLVFDNASSPADVKEYLPAPVTGHVVVTSRSTNWPNFGGSLPLGTLSRGEAISLLRKRTARNDSNESASKLCQALGDLPIAVDQAAAVIAQKHISFVTYLAGFESLWAELLTSGRHWGDCPDAVAMALELSLRQLEQSSPGAAEMLALCAFLAHEQITRPFLASSAPYVAAPLSGALADAMTLDASLALLGTHSMLHAGEHAIAAHPLVASFVRTRMSAETRRRWTDVALQRVAAAFVYQSQDVSTWSSCGEVLPHVLAVAEHGEREQVGLADVARLLDDAGRYLHRMAHFAQAKDLFARAIAIYERVCGISHPKVSFVANNLGRVMTRLGDHAAAQKYFERALEIDRGTYGHDDPHTATVVNNYAMALHALGDAAAAREHFERALEVYESHYGPDHVKTAGVLNNLGFVAYELGDLEAAQSCLERALQITEASVGPSHPTVASVLGNLANVRRALGDARQALADLQRALAIDEAAYGVSHPDVARDLYWLGLLLESTSDYEAARDCFERSLAIDEAVYGPEHRQLVYRLNALGRVQAALGERDAAARQFNRAAGIVGRAREAEK
jgi:tetratricopeptide (TPR) repeat protein